MSVCTTCGVGELKTVRGDSRRSFYQTCSNRRCKATFELVLGIADAVSTLPRETPKKQKKNPASGSND
jgi:hypothetical protein